MSSVSTTSLRPQRLVAAGPRGPIAYELWGGDRPPLVLVAGLGQRANLWGELPRLLADRFTVLAADNRGVGGSRSGQPFTLEGAADDLPLVLDHAGLESAGVLGVSMGGLIATLLAAHHPTRVASLVVASCVARLTPSHARILRFFELLMSRLRPAEAAEALMAFAFGSAYADRFPGFVDQAARLWTLEEDDLPGVLQQVAHLKTGWDLRGAAASITCPTLVVAGELDAIAPAIGTRELAAAIPEARYREVPGAAHSVLAEGGGALLTEILDFLQS
jgi:pimeloyl-ACP methyl ester carboxylesterase